MTAEKRLQAAERALALRRATADRAPITTAAEAIALLRDPTITDDEWPARMQAIDERLTFAARTDLRTVIRMELERRGEKVDEEAP